MTHDLQVAAPGANRLRAFRARLRLVRSCLLCICFVLAGESVSAQKAATAEVRQAIQTAFERLQANDYGALYDALPQASRRRIGRERFVRALENSRGAYKLDRVETGQPSVAGDVAAIDTTLYGSVRRPVEGEGRIEVRQYLVREEGSWRVVTDDRAAVRRLLNANPTLARRFPQRAPRVFVKQNGEWVEIGIQKPQTSGQ